MQSRKVAVSAHTDKSCVVVLGLQRKIGYKYFALTGQNVCRNRKIHDLSPRGTKCL